MPNQKILEEKKEMVAAISAELTSAASGVLVDYKGITVDADTKLRKELRAADVKYSVVKNSLLRFASKSAGFDAMEQFLTGTTAGGLIEAMGYVNFYLFTTAVAMPGVFLYGYMVRSGLADVSMGTAGRDQD